MAMNIEAAFRHPDVPLIMTREEQEDLARFIAAEVCRRQKQRNVERASGPRFRR